MMGYKNMTFCPFYLDCTKKDVCDRPLTPEVKIQADMWWGEADAPICVYMEKPDCWSERIRS